MDDVEFKNSEMYQDLSAAEQAKYESMSLQDQIEFRETYGRGATEGTMGTLENAGFSYKRNGNGVRISWRHIPWFW